MPNMGKLVENFMPQNTAKINDRNNIVEIVIPIMLMSYLSLGTITDYTSISELKTLLLHCKSTYPYRQRH